MKPDWKDAPEWATYLAMDEDKEWYWFEKRPVTDGGIWRNRQRAMGKTQPASDIPKNWKNTLESRHDA